MTSVNTPWRCRRRTVRAASTRVSKVSSRLVANQITSQPRGKCIQRLTDAAQRQDHAGKDRKAQDIGTHQHRHLSAAGDGAEALVVKNERRQHRRDQRRLTRNRSRSRERGQRRQPLGVEQGAEGGGEEEA